MKGPVLLASLLLAGGLAAPAGAATLMITAGTTVTGYSINCFDGGEDCFAAQNLPPVGTSRSFAFGATNIEDVTDGTFNTEIGGFAITGTVSGGQLVAVSGFDLFASDACGPGNFSATSAQFLFTETRCDFDGFVDVGYAGSDVTLAYSLGNGAVPEPATWAVLVLGFGVAGAAMRRRRRQTTAPQPSAGVSPPLA